MFNKTVNLMVCSYFDDSRVKTPHPAVIPDNLPSTTIHFSARYSIATDGYTPNTWFVQFPGSVPVKIIITKYLLHSDTLTFRLPLSVVKPSAECVNNSEKKPLIGN